MTKSFLILVIAFGLIAGVLLAAQPGVNGTLGKKVQHPLQASVISFGTGFAILLIISICTGCFPPHIKEGSWGQIPFWVWTGGSIGVFMVTTSLIFGPRIGAVGWLGLVMTGQMIGSVIFDHYGIIGYPQQRLNLMRIGGIGFLVLGMALIFAGTRTTKSTNPSEAVSHEPIKNGS